MRGYFARCVGVRKNTSNEQNVSMYYMLNHRIRDLLFHYKKILLFWLFFSRKSVEIHPAFFVCPSVSARANDINTESQ